MAESSAATQSPSVSSSSSGVEPSAPGGGGGSPGACPTLGPKSCGSSCADSFVSSSSSQPVSLFSTSQEELSSLCSDELPSEIMSSSFLSSSEIPNPNHTTLGERGEVLGSPPAAAKEGKDPLALLDARKMKQPQGTSKDGADSPASLAAGVPSIPSSFPQRPASLSKEAGLIGERVSKDQEPKSPSKIASREDRSALNAGQSKTEGICTYSLPPSEVSGGGAERDSPESPFEVIIDKATFDREFKDSYKESTNDMGSWTAHSDRESTADMLETDDKLLPLRSKEAGRYPASVLFARQFSHTTAALEEVSKCVNDMHNFTNEILTWDLVPQVKQQTDKSSDCTTKSTTLDRSECHSEIPVINLKTNTLEKMPLCSGNGSTPITKSSGAWSETSLSQDDVIGKPVGDPLNSTKEVSAHGMQGSARKQEDVLSKVPGSLCDRPVSWGLGAATVKVLSPDDCLRDGVNWPSSVLGELTEADSSGDSDDTVIEDITTDTSFENNKIEPGKPVPIPSAIAQTNEREIKEMANCETVGKKTSENSEELASNSEPPRGQPDARGRSPGGAGVCSQAPETSSTGASEKLTAQDSPTLPSAPTSVFTEAEFSPTMTASAMDSSQRKDVKDTDDSSPEDLRAALMETREETIEDQEGRNVLDTVLEKTVGLKSTSPEEVLHERNPDGSESKDTKSKYGEHSKAARGSACPSQGSAVASLDLEQEQLTIRALKEIGEQHVEKSASVQGEERQTFAPQSWPQRSSDFVEHTGEKTGSDLGISKKPTVIQETRVDYISSLNKTELVNKNILARLLTHFSVRDLIFWRDVKKTGFVFGTTLIVLLSLAAFSVISVVSYLILALLSVTISFRVYKSVIQAVQKSEEGHPFKAYLDVDVTLSSEAFHSYMNAAMVHVNRALKLIIRLFLVEDLVDSLKLAVFMWLMTYVGAVFNGITLLILAELLVFSVPIVYEKYKTQIDHYVGIARDQTKSIVEKIQAKLPGIAKKKAE